MTFTAKSKAFLLLLVPVIAFFLFKQPSLDSASCLDINSEVAICAASDMAKLTDVGPVPSEHPLYDLGLNRDVSLRVAKNETLAFQLILQRRAEGGSERAAITIDDFELEVSDAPHSNSSQTKQVILSSINISLFQAWYHPIDDSGYTAGADSDVLEWPANYPDALVPQRSGCGVDQETMFDSFTLPQKVAGNQAVWVDIYVPKDQPVGMYQSAINITLEGDVPSDAITVPITLEVVNATLPGKPSYDAVGEVYRAYKLEGVGSDRTTRQWQEMAHCYQRLAHQHRMVFVERWPDAASTIGWAHYKALTDPILNGSLFSPKNGYIGPGESTGVHIWRTPWPQDYDIKLDESLGEKQLAMFEALASDWQQQVETNQWFDTTFFAYVFDEVDGRTDESADVDDMNDNYLMDVHQAMGDVQLAIDKGAGHKNLDLIWTSHANPAQWQGQEGLDLVGKVRFWAPNGGAAPPTFLAQRREAGERIWFYHNGHPAVGTHNINASGIEMRSWGVIGARYGFDGQFMWAVNLGQDDAPFRQPTYRVDDDRVGTGVIVYPGYQLEKIGYRAVAGPIPSMRMKAWRRGLQDAELALLAKNKGYQQEVEQLLEALVPVALADAAEQGYRKPQWSQDPYDWIELRLALLKLAANPSRDTDD